MLLLAGLVNFNNNFLKKGGEASFVPANSDELDLGFAALVDTPPRCYPIGLVLQESSRAPWESGVCLVKRLPQCAPLTQETRCSPSLLELQLEHFAWASLRLPKLAQQFPSAEFSSTEA